MTFIPDGAPFSYGEEPEPGLVAVGWLDAAEPFAQGPVPSEFVERLRIICRDHTVRLMRGWHYCNLCPPAPGPGLGEPTSVASPDGEFPVGHGEIRVQGPSGIRYAAPEMIIHYVETHGYVPPDDFIEGVLADAPSSE